MSVGNIVDRRTNKYVVVADVVFEPSWHDNTCKGASRFPVCENSLGNTVWGKSRIDIHAAIRIAQGKRFPVTIYIYDRGADPIGAIAKAEEGA